MLRPRDLLLLGLAGLLDVAEEIRDPMQIMSKGYENMYGFVPTTFKRNNYNHLVWRNLKTGYIEKVEKNGDIYLRLTTQGKDKTIRDFPLLAMQNRVWDRKWRIIMFDIEETQRRARDTLRNKLKELGFGMLQESVFVTPYDVVADLTEFINYIGLLDAVYVLEATKIAVGNQKELANTIWKLDAINGEYEEIVREAKGEYLKYESGRVNRLNRERVRKMHLAFLNVLLSDPFLPRELLPIDWKAEEAKKHIKMLVKYSKYE